MARNWDLKAGLNTVCGDMDMIVVWVHYHHHCYYEIFIQKVPVHGCSRSQKTNESSEYLSLASYPRTPLKVTNTPEYGNDLSISPLSTLF